MGRLPAKCVDIIPINSFRKIRLLAFSIKPSWHTDVSKRTPPQRSYVAPIPRANVYAYGANPGSVDVSGLFDHGYEDGCVTYPLADCHRANADDVRHGHVHEYASSVREYAGGRGVRLNATTHPMPSIVQPTTTGL